MAVDHQVERASERLNVQRNIEAANRDVGPSVCGYQPCPPG